MSDRNILFNISDRAVLIISMVLAVLFWFLNRMSESYSMEIAIPVVYEQPDSMAFSAPPIKSVVYVVNSKGWKLLGISKEKIETDTIHIALDKSRQQTISQSQLHRYVNDGPLGKLDIIDTRPENIKIKQEAAVYKKVPVMLFLSVDFKPNYNIVGQMKLSPDSIWIKGPASDVKNITRWEADSVSYTALKDTVQQVISLVKPRSRVVSLSRKQVKLIIPIEQYTENTLYAPVQIINKKDSSIQVFPNQIRLKFKVPISKFNSVSKEDFKITVDASSKIIENNKLLVNITQKSPWIKDLDYEPKLVEFFIKSGSGSPHNQSKPGIN